MKKNKNSNNGNNNKTNMRGRFSFHCAPWWICGQYWLFITFSCLRWSHDVEIVCWPGLTWLAASLSADWDGLVCGAGSFSAWQFGGGHFTHQVVKQAEKSSRGLRDHTGTIRLNLFSVTCRTYVCDWKYNTACLVQPKRHLDLFWGILSYFPVPFLGLTVPLASHHILYAK